MKIKLGRLIDHVHLEVADLAASRRFYEAALAALGRAITGESAGHFASDELWVTSDDTPTARLHLAFQADSEDAVRSFYEAGLAHGGQPNGEPGPRAYHPGYFAAYLLDPDGNNIEAVWHGASTRSAAAVEVTPAGPM